MPQPTERRDQTQLLSSGRKHDHIELLERIDASGSISAAANALGMSYKAAWNAVESINNLAEHPLVRRRVGGRRGGGAELTPRGRRLVAAYRRLEKEREQVLAHLNQVMDDFDEYYQMIRRFDMKTSARNQFLGKVKSIKEGAVNAEVILDIGGGELAAIITHDSLKHLNLKEGVEAYALIKASWVIVSKDEDFKISARNRLCGTLARCQEGSVNDELIIELPGGKTLTAIVTKDSSRELALKEGMRLCALIKASHIILATAA
ncbi:MAG: TOBE domain-containing protein [Methylothermaceae bacterium]|nr:TOBE domain-containing protein [Methylothermaceae bacterium]